MKIAICDDDGLWLHKSERIIKEYCEEQNTMADILLYSNSAQLMMDIDQIDMLFMDIELGRENGVEIVKRIKEMNPDCFVVFVTNHLYYASDVYDAKHEMFVTKEQFAAKLDQVKKLYDKIDYLNKGELPIYTIDKVAALLAVQRIKYLERAERITTINTTHGRYQLKDKIEELQSKLQEYDFIRCHKSYAVNPVHVQECRKTEFVLHDGQTVPISRRYSKASMEQYLQWMSAHIL